MDIKESADYLRHHIKLAGREDQLFSDDATALLHKASRAIPVGSTTSRPKRSSPATPSGRRSSPSPRPGRR
jgi:hypothetical protein